MAKLHFKPFQPPTKTDAANTWHILVIDDDTSVHNVTQLVLNNYPIDGNDIHVHNAYSAAEAKQLLAGDIEFCAALIDVVMESDQAGLALVKWIREDLCNQNIRLILRTGQAGKAPEEQAIREYDINDYRSKTELTAVKLTTTIHSAVRGYRDIKTIQKSLDAFRKLMTSSTNILKIDNLPAFANAALENLMALLDMNNSAFYIARHQQDFFNQTDEMILASTGRFGRATDTSHKPIPADIKKAIDHAFVTQTSQTYDHHYIGYYRTSADTSSVLYIELDNETRHLQSHLIQLYATQVALILEKLSQRQQSERIQQELMYIVGDAIEARSQETGGHVKRVSLLCELIAQTLNCSAKFTEALRIAAPLHDLGKISIPENILHKPGKLDSEEWNVMQSHANVGAHMLAKSTLPIAKMGNNLAHWHHENWDGSGYPDQLKGEEIPLEARIMAIADVFDALGSKRCYKNPWPDSAIKTFIINQRGKKFDPHIVDAVIENFDECLRVRAQVCD